MNFLNVPERTKGNRTEGITSVVDFGIPIGELNHILTDYHSYIDFAKMGVGTAYITPNIKEKVELYQQFGVKPYFGGTLFEKCYVQNQMSALVSFLKEIGVEWIEVSNGTLDIPLVTRLMLIQELKKDFKVLGEVGSKDDTVEMAASQWHEEMQALLDAGCTYVITEGRSSGTSGIYSKTGEIKTALILDAVEGIEASQIIFEAAKSAHQMYFINQFGANVNIGNVPIRDVLLLEAQRQGLRSETFFWAEEDSLLEKG